MSAHKRKAVMQPSALIIRVFLLVTVLVDTANMQTFARGMGDTSIVHLNELLEPTTKRKAVFLAKGVKVGDSYVLIAFDLDNFLMYRGTYSDKRYTVKKGIATYYYPNGQQETAGNYHSNRKNGIWKSWYPDGSLKDSGDYKYDLKTGTWISWHPNGALKERTTIIQLEQFTPRGAGKAEKNVIAVAHGTFSSWYENGKPERQGNYHHGRQIALWRYFHRNGNISTEEWNNATGKVDSMRCYDDLGRFQTNFCSLDKPALLKDFGDFRTYITKELKLPADGITEWPNGDVTIRFTVNEAGEMKDLKVISNNRMLAQTIHQTMKSLPGWEPAVSHNRVVLWNEEVTLDFGFNRTKNKKQYVQQEDFPLNAYEVEDDWN